MKDIPQTIRFTTRDLVNYASFHSELTENITSSNREAAKELALNDDWNTAKTIAGIKDAAEELSKGQIRAGDEIARSIQSNTDRTLHRMDYNTDRNLDNRDFNTDRIVGVLDDLKGVFEWKLSELIWIQEKQSDYLKEILETLKKPRLTRANELREDGLRKYNKGWIDEAIDDLNKAREENNTDFIVHQSLGNIYLFQKKDPKKALKCYENASKYAIEFPYYDSYALLHVGLSNYFLGYYEDAYDATKEAIERSPKLFEAYYQNARYCSKLGRYDEALSNLRIAIDADRTYCARTLLEDDFEPMIGKVKDFFESLRIEARNKAEKEIERAHNLVNEFSSIDALDASKKKLDEAEALKRNGSYINNRDAIYKAYTAEKLAVDSLIRLLSDREAKLESDYTREKSAIGERPSFSYIHSWGWWAGSILIALIGLFHGNLIMVLIGSIFPAAYIWDLYTDISRLNKYNENKKIAEDKMVSLSREITLDANNLSRVKSQKQKLKLDEIFSGLNNMKCENYLLKNYG